MSQHYRQIQLGHESRCVCGRHYLSNRELSTFAIYNISPHPKSLQHLVLILRVYSTLSLSSESTAPGHHLQSLQHLHPIIIDYNTLSSSSGSTASCILFSSLRFTACCPHDRSLQHLALLPIVHQHFVHILGLQHCPVP